MVKITRKLTTTAGREFTLGLDGLAFNLAKQWTGINLMLHNSPIDTGDGLHVASIIVAMAANGLELLPVTRELTRVGRGHEARELNDLRFKVFDELSVQDIVNVTKIWGEISTEAVKGMVPADTETPLTPTTPLN